MGCSSSKLDDEEAVQLCKDRKKFIKQAVEQSLRFAAGHNAYIESMRRVSAALRDYIEVDEPREFLMDSFTTPPPVASIKRPASGFITISPKSFSVSPLQSGQKSTLRVNYLRSGGNPSVSVEQRPPQSPEAVRMETYSPMYQHYGMDGFFSMQSPPVTSSIFHYSPDNRPSYPPPSPQVSQWDSFWNPFSSLDYYGYPTRTSIGHSSLDDDIAGLRQVREEEGIPELEEESEYEEVDHMVDVERERPKVERNFDKDKVIVEDVDDDDDDDDDDDEDDDDDNDDDETENGTDTDHELHGTNSNSTQKIKISKLQNPGRVIPKETSVTNGQPNDETPGFTVYVNRRPTSMAEVIRDLEAQFTAACDSADEVSSILEARRAQYASASNDLAALKMLNPVALIRSASSRSSSARFLTNSSTSKAANHDSSSDMSEESSTFLHGHQSTLDRLYAWEKKLYQEVREGERTRRAYEKKCSQLKSQDVKGVDPSTVGKTRAAIRDLHTQIKVSIHSVEAISKRIETLRDEELQPQLIDLVQGLAKMWKVMAECHQKQKRTLDEAKILLANMPSRNSGMKKYTIMSPSEPHHLARSAANLEMELRNWRACFESWVKSQRSYIHALRGWLLRCVRMEPELSRLPFSPRRSLGAPPIFAICIHWSRFLDSVREAPVLEGLEFFSAGVGSLYAQQLREDSRRTSGGSRRFRGESIGNMEMVEVGQLEEEFMSAEKMAEVAIRVLCAGMSVAVSSLTEFALSSAEGYADLLKQPEGRGH
ncbi:OLC1v1035977C1 [Oldenlandia corymbosa var. corymbosa]|uniref:OLC1v1035977C1 n=1 Tax=Oldenlandia corymbosa var. corymbosa TaxID=529605 RepID=A0AAV1CXN2_OLDCO|nr:OLC1v1035977C1 [Oldenlandia corymbosa var. corymbosa]